MFAVGVGVIRSGFCTAATIRAEDTRGAVCALARRCGLTSAGERRVISAGDSWAVALAGEGFWFAASAL